MHFESTSPITYIYRKLANLDRKNIAELVDLGEEKLHDLTD